MDILEKITQEPAFTTLPSDIQTLILQVAEPAVGIHAQLAKQPLPITANKFAGVPFIAQTDDIPRDSKNRPYFLLAQFNFADIKQKAGQHPKLPETGLLQIFIPAFDPNHGGNRRLYEEDKHIIRFYKEDIESLERNDSAIDHYRQFYREMLDFFKEKRFIDELDTDYNEEDKKMHSLDFFQKYDEPYLPVLQECELTFTAQLSKPSEEEVNIDFSDLKAWEEQIGAEGLAYFEHNETPHRLLGFAQAFAQGDPRAYYLEDDDDLSTLQIRDSSEQHLLLEISSQYIDDPKHKFSRYTSHKLIMWWDVGLAHFFITDADLANRNFQNVELNIDGG